MEMPFGKHKGMQVDRLPRPYLEWLKKKEPPIYGMLQVEVFKALGLKPPVQPKEETLDEILDRVTKEVFNRFQAREVSGEIEGSISEV